ncbi:hypothetical protein Z968_03010 [Clostridium novyi A str. 4552]|uniref:Glycosyl transferase family 1 domain-containing protein n=1 Tax=Clostridium novyi A str. 4552 TaxID=1444289 RepID=A0A0A0ID27_CLONO|nr:glycosyltransferase [Clostridium novyi]KGM97505.1 hypothetical protein Z968_03010 [Clostridium novyi A str. 4552]
MIIQIGPYPPPLGGISIFIKRMNLVLNSKGINNKVWSNSCKHESLQIKSVKLRNLLKEFLRMHNNIDILHFNITGIKPKIYISILNLIFFRNKKKILTIHGESKYLYKSTYNIMTKVLNTFDTIICVKNGDKSYLQSKGVCKPIYEIPAYINPIQNQDDFELIPKDVWNFINKSKFLICGNGAIRFNNNEDLYGLDMLVNLIKKLRKNNKNVSLLFCVLSVENQSKKEKEYYYYIKEQIIKYNLQNNILLYEVENTEFYPILQKSNLFIRPTNTDGDAVSLREALYFKVPSIASNVVNRPDGIVLFNNRDLDSLYLKVNDVINNYSNYKNKLNNIQMKDNSQSILDIYNKLINKK